MEWKVDRREVKRYLGYGRTEADDKILYIIEECIVMLQKAACPKFLYAIYSLKMLENSRIDFEVFQTVSENLAKNLKGCERVVLFAATLGVEVDRMIARYSRTHITESTVMQAVAAVMIEEYCDSCQETIKQETERQGWYMRPRFSPGYGDFSLEHQTDIIGVLQCPKKIGLTVTDSLLLVPIKSVTAVMGLSRTKQPCHKHGCEECLKSDCRFRR